MTTPEIQPAVPPPEPPRFQFSLRTLLLLFVVLGSSMAVFGAWGIGVFGVIVGLAICLHYVKSLAGLSIHALYVLCLMCLSGLPIPAVSNVHHGTSDRVVCTNNMREIAMALHQYHQANGCFPPVFLPDKSGKPLHSWRVLILPYLKYDDLYKSLDLAQPSNSPRNWQMLLDGQPQEFECPNDHHAKSPSSETSCLAVVGTNAAWTVDKPRKLADFGKDASITIMLVDLGLSGIRWAEPRDLSADNPVFDDNKLPRIVPLHQGGRPDGFFFKYEHGSGTHVAMADGCVRFLRTDNLTADDLRQILQIGGCKEGTTGARAFIDESTWHLNWPNIAALAAWLLSVGMLLTRAVRCRKVLPAPPPPS